MKQFRKIQTKIDELSKTAFHPKYLPFTIGLTGLLVVFYGFFFFQWLNDMSAPRSVGGRVAELELIQTTPASETNQQITFQAQVGDIQNRTVHGIQFVAVIKGEVPADIRFTPSPIDGLQPLVATISQEGSDSVLKVVFVTILPNPYTVTSPTIDLGKLEFTRPEKGELTLEFNPYLAKMVEKQTAVNFMASPRPLTLKY